MVLRPRSVLNSQNTMATAMLKVEAEADACCVCGSASGELISPEEYDASAPPMSVPLRAVLARLAGGGGAPPAGRLCGGCLQRALEAHEFAGALRARAPQPLSDKIRALRRQLGELTKQVDVFIVVGGTAAGAGVEGQRAYTEDDIIMVERGALAAAAEPAHARNARGDPVYQCSVCPLSFQLASEYRSHCLTHPDDALHSCWTCGAQFPSRALLQDHAAEQHAPNNNTCYICNTNFQNESEVRNHEATCPSLCPLCGAPHATRQELRAHAAAVHSIPRAGQPALCPVCCMQQTTAAALTAHLLQHRQQRHYVCGYHHCVLRFPNRSALMAHIRKVHAAPEPPQHACEHCPSTFATPAALRRHERSHVNEQTVQEVEEEVVEGEEYAEGEGEVEYLEMDTLEQD